MLKRRVTPELWKLLIEEIRENLDTPIERIALAHHVEPASLLTWYESGVEAADGYDTSQFIGGGAPIKTLVFLSRVKTRAAMSEDYTPPAELVKGGASRKAPKAKVTRTSKYKLSKAWEAAKDDAIESLALKGKSARAARSNAAALLGITGQMLQIAKPLLKRLEDQMADPEFISGLDAFGVVALYGKLARMGKDVMECAKMADEIEAALLGDPNSMATVETLDDVSDQDALAIIEEAARAAEMAKEGALAERVAGYTGADDED